jgi:hypothetical protein
VLPTYALDTGYYAKAALAALATAGVTGLLMGLFPAFEFWAALLMGIAVPEAVTGVANQKRGPGLQAVAIGSIVFGFVLSRVVMEVFPDFVILGGINRPSYYDIPPLFGALPFYLTQYTILWLVMAVFLAYRRLQ